MCNRPEQFVRRETEMNVDVIIDVGECIAIVVVIFILALLLFNYCEEGPCKTVVDIRNRTTKPDILKNLEVVETKPVATV